MTASVGDEVTPANPRLSTPGLGARVEVWTPDGTDDACPWKASVPSVGAEDDTTDGCSRGLDALSVGDGVAADETCPPEVTPILVGAGDPDDVGCPRRAAASLSADAVGAAENCSTAVELASVGEADGAEDDCPCGVPMS